MSESDALVPPQKLSDLTELSIRQGFVRKVYSLLTVQLLITVVVGGIVMKHAVKMPKDTVVSLLLVSMACSMGMMCVFMCCPKVMRSFPLNYFLLFGFTLAEGVMVGFISAAHTKESVLIAAVLTTLIVAALTLFACQTSYDFTTWGPYLFSFFILMLGFGMIMSMVSMTTVHNSPAFHGLRLAMSAAGALLFSFYLIYDTQKIIGGKHEQQFSIDDYASAAICLYIDIIQLFIHLLRIFGERN